MMAFQIVENSQKTIVTIVNKLLSCLIQLTSKIEVLKFLDFIYYFTQ